MSLFTWYDENDHSIWVKGLHYIDDDCITQVPINSATVHAQVTSADGATDVGGLITLSYVAGSDGTYRGNTADFLDPGNYRIRYTITSPDGNGEKWDDIIAKERA